jgi:hypothetical protein
MTPGRPPGLGTVRLGFRIQEYFGVEGFFRVWGFRILGFMVFYVGFRV